jgi:hypothetical protein
MSQTLVENPVQVSETGGNQPPFNASGTTLPRAHLVTPLPNTNTTGPDSPTSSLVIADSPPVNSDEEEEEANAATLAPLGGTAAGANCRILELQRILQMSINANDALIKKNQELEKSNAALVKSNAELEKLAKELKSQLKGERCASTRQRTEASDQSMARAKENRTKRAAMEQMQAANAELTAANAKLTVANAKLTAENAKSIEHLKGLIKNLAEPSQNGRDTPPLIAGSVSMDVAMIAARYAHMAQFLGLLRRLVTDYEKKIETLSKSSGNDKSPAIDHYKERMAELQRSINECLSAMTALVENGPPGTRNYVMRTMLSLPRMYNIPQHGSAIAVIDPNGSPTASVAESAVVPVAASVANSATTLFTKPATVSNPATAPATNSLATAPAAISATAPVAMPVKRTASQADQDTDGPATELGKRMCVNDSADALDVLADVAVEQYPLSD